MRGITVLSYITDVQPFATAGGINFIYMKYDCQ